MTGTKRNTVFAGMHPRRKMSALVVGSVLVLVTACGSDGSDTGATSEDAWPTGNINWVVPSSAGGGFDRNTRLVEPGISDALGVNMTVENVPGGNYVIGTSKVLREGDECNTILTQGAELLILSNLMQEAGYETDDFVPVGQLTSESYVFRVRNDTPWQNMEELVAAAKADPGAIRYGVASVTDAVPMRMFMGLTDTEFNVILYEGGGEARLAMLNGEIDVALIGVFNGIELDEATRVIGVLDDENPFPDVTDDAETVNEQLGSDIPAWTNTNGIFVTRTCAEEHPERFEKLQEAFASAVEDPAYVERLEGANSADLMNIRNSEEYKEYIDELQPRLAELVETYDLQL
jgi:tripartite-type tricarboxylate transporter receptor subunit TctC